MTQRGRSNWLERSLAEKQVGHQVSHDALRDYQHVRSGGGEPGPAEGGPEEMRTRKDATGSTGFARAAGGAEPPKSEHRIEHRMASGGAALAHDHGGERQSLLVSVDEAAKMLCIGRTVAYQLMHKGELQSVKIGRIRRVVVSSIGEYVRRLMDEAS